MIDIIGRACRLPGASSVEAFRQLLFEERCTVTEIPSDRWAHWRYLHPVVGTAGKSYSFAAGVLDDIWGFDGKVFNISPREASQMDPQQRLLLQLTWEALEDAGIPPSELEGKEVGVYVGASALDHGNRLIFDPNVTDAYTMTGNTLSLASNRISHAFDLRGPSMTVDTACSSSLVALNEAVLALRSGVVDFAIVGGVNILANPASFIGFSAARMLSPTGRCKSFSATADGYVRAEGGVVLVLQREDCEGLAGSRSYGRIVGSGSNNDGRTLGVALPDAGRQTELLERIYCEAKIDPEDLSFVEAHGTGTLVGDPIEAEALGTALGRHRSKPLPIGSVKSNIGHLEPASGLAGVLKALIAIEENRLPASLHAEDLNPHIQFDKLNLELATQIVELPEPVGKSLAGISSFGFGGSNAHVIIAGPDPIQESTSVPADHRTPLFFASAFCKDALRQLSWRYATRFEDGDHALTARLCNQATYHRGVYPHRIAITCQSGVDVRSHLEAFLANAKDPRVFTASSNVHDAPPALVYSGNGAQYNGMSQAALSSDPVFAQQYDKIDQRFKSMAGWSIKDKLTDPDLTEELGRAEIAQALLFAEQAALTHALIERGLEPAVVFGHSGGEVAAAYASGALDLDQALLIIHERSKSQGPLSGCGAMAALQLPEEDSIKALEEFGASGVEIAAVNSPGSISLTGPTTEIEQFIRWARRERRWACLKLSVNYPYHSRMQDQVEEELRSALQHIEPRASKIPFISSVTGLETRGEDLDVDYWWSNVRQPVRFLDAVQTAYEQGHRVFFECGPQPVLASYLGDSLADHGGDHVITHSFEKSETTEVNPVDRSFCRAFVNGARIDKKRVYGEPSVPDKNLPHYPWQNVENRCDLTPPIRVHFNTDDGVHPMLGTVTGGANTLWLRHMDAHLMPIFAGHVVGGRSIVPGSGFIEMASAAAQRFFSETNIELRDLDLVAPLPLMQGQTLEVRTEISSDNRSLKISSQSVGGDDDWRVHASCRIGELATQDKPDLQAPNQKKLKSDEDGQILYRLAHQLGMDYGPSFQLVSHFRQAGDNVIEVVLKDTKEETKHNQFCLDPVKTDAVFHGLLAVLHANRTYSETRGYVPVHAGRIRLLQPGGSVKSGRIEIVRIGNRSIAANFFCFDGEGELIAKLEELRFRAVRLASQLDLNAHSYGYHLYPIKQLETEGVAAEGASLEAISELFLETAGQPEFEPQDESYLIVEATAQRIAYDAIRALSDKRGYLVVPDNETEEDAAADQVRQSYVNGLVQIIRRADLAHEEEEGWIVDAECGLPPANELIAGLLADNPEYAAECALLSHAQAILPDLFKGKLEWDPNMVFGRNALEGVSAGSALARKRNRLLADCLPSLETLVHRGQCLRIAEIVNPLDGGSVRFGQFSTSSNVELFRLCSDVDQLSTLSSRASARSGLRITDLSLDPAEIEKFGPFDLVIVPAELHSVAGMDDLLPALGKQMSPGGVFLCLADAPDSFHDLILGVDPSWFDQSAVFDFPVGALRTGEEWETTILAAGFEQVRQARLPDGLSGLNLIVAAAPSTQPEAEGACDSAEGEGHEEPQGDQKTASTALTDRPFEQALAVHLSANDEAEGAPGRAEFDDEAQVWLYRQDEPNGDRLPLTVCYFPIVVDDCAPQGTLEARIAVLSQMLVKKAETKADIWVILPRGASYSGVKEVIPAHVALWSLMRTASNEFAHLDIHCVDINPAQGTSAGTVFELIQAGSQESEIVFTDQVFGALRVQQGLGSVVNPSGAHFDPSQYRTGLPLTGTDKLDELEWRLSDRRTPSSREVEIGIEAVGLNYRDVMWALGMLPEEALEKGFAGPTFGIECAGKVLRVGEMVNDLKIGDRVLAIGPACFSSHLSVDRACVGLIPDDIGFAEAATLPVTYFTAYYAMVHLAGLKSGEKVLIHGAAGGVGLAAIQIAKMCGAEIFATAGSPVKRSLLRSLDVDHVLDSRSLAFADDVHSITGGNGVDVVLNSLAGVAMELGLTVLRPFGRFLELGKQDFYANTKIGLRALKENISYFGIDADQLLAARAEESKLIFDKMVELFASGDLTPLPHRVFEADRLTEAFKLMQRSGHIGKIVVKPKLPQKDLAFESTPRFRATPDGAHVIVGGLGGLGLELMQWLADLGASTIVLVGRSAKTTRAVQRKISDLKKRGVDVRVMSGDVSDKAALEALFSELRAEVPIKGIFHTAMVLDDVQIKSLDAKTLKRTLDSKVTGSENLDQVSRVDDLDYFVLFSSVATLIGNIGQGAYVAANGYLEGLARRRQAAGLPAMAIGWGAVTDAGYLTQNKDKAKIVNAMTGNVDFPVRQALQSLNQLLAMPEHLSVDAVMTVSPMTWYAAVTALKTLNGPTYGVLANLGERTGDVVGQEDLRASLMKLSPEDREKQLIEFIGGTISGILRIPIKDLNVSSPISELGMDSLMGVEFGLAAQRALGEDIPLMSVSDALSIKDIAAKISSYLSNASDSEKDSNLENLAAQHEGELGEITQSREFVSDVTKREAKIVTVIR